MEGRESVPERHHAAGISNKLATLKPMQEDGTPKILRPLVPPFNRIWTFPKHAKTKIKIPRSPTFNLLKGDCNRNPLKPLSPQTAAPNSKPSEAGAAFKSFSRKRGSSGAAKWFRVQGEVKGFGV